MMENHKLLCRALAPVLLACASLAHGDSLTVQGLDAGEDAVVALNARARFGVGCLRGQEAVDWVTRSLDAKRSVSLGNLEKGCVLNVVVFSRNHAMRVARIDGWTSDDGEARVVTVQPAIKVPVTVWITHNALESVAKGHMARADELYRKNLVGIVFEPKFRNVSAQADKVKLINAGIGPVGDLDSMCKNIEALRGHAYTARALNVYYVNRDIVARNCATKRSPICGEFGRYPKANGNVTYIGVLRPDNPTTLAHELGHAFGLRPGPCGGHVPVDRFDFPGDNIMIGAGDSRRDHFSLGQVFRMNTQKDRWGGTMLIANQLRKGPGRSCQMLPWEHTDSVCPAHCLDRIAGACGGP